MFIKICIRFYGSIIVNGFKEKLSKCVLIVIWLFILWGIYIVEYYISDEKE